MVPHATAGVDRRRSSPVNPSPQAYKFPEFKQSLKEEEGEDDISRGPSPAPLLNGLPAGLHSSERWPHRKEPPQRTWRSWANGGIGGFRRQRQKSLSEAIKTVRTRKGSISENANEIAESLKAPVSMKLVILCVGWYGTSILTNTSSKAILTAFPKPVTLTILQFFLVCSWCIILSALAKRSARVRNALPVVKNGIRRPNKEVLLVTLPLTAFQIGGHVFNSYAMSRIPVSLVHTIKGLSPLMTVLVYRFYFSIHYSIPTYLSLIPLTLGVILACSAKVQGNILGLTYGFGSAVLFVTQNIASKKIFNDSAKAEQDGTPVTRRKPDKLNLLCYSSGLALLLTFPLWLWSEGFDIAADFLHDGSVDLRQRPGSLDHGALAAEFIFNGTFHFSQSLVAFVLLGQVSPVTYSVASLIKRVAVIMFAIVWFGNPMTRVQGFGFGLTFLGLYLYDRTSDAAKADKRAREKIESLRPLLPVSAADASRSRTPVFSEDSNSATDSPRSNSVFGKGESSSAASEKSPGFSLPNGAPSEPLSIGTKAAETWNAKDVVR